MLHQRPVVDLATHIFIGGTCASQLVRRLTVWRPILPFQKELHYRRTKMPLQVNVVQKNRHLVLMGGCSQFACLRQSLEGKGGDGNGHCTGRCY